MNDEQMLKRRVGEGRANAKKKKNRSVGGATSKLKTHVVGCKEQMQKSQDVGSDE